jgi:hypothetical protein
MHAEIQVDNAGPAIPEQEYVSLFETVRGNGAEFEEAFSWADKALLALLTHC